MRKAVRITAWILGLLFLLQVGIMVVLQSPRVQTYLGKKVIERLQDRMDADIYFKAASVRPFDAIVLDEVLVMDQAPTVAGMDTLLYVNHLSARFSVMGLLKGGSISVSRLTLDGGCFHLIIEPDPHRPGHTSTNLQRIFRIVSKGEHPEMHWGDLLSARRVEINNVHFRMENLPGAARYEERGYEIPEGVIDWNHLNLILEHLKVSHLRIADDLISCTAQDMYVQELATGLRLDGLSVRKVRVGMGNAHLDDFQGRLGSLTYLDMPSFDMNGKLDIYEDFEQSVELDILLREGSTVDMQDIAHFAPHLDAMGFKGSIKGRVYGPVSDFHFSDLVIRGLEEDIFLRAGGRMTGLPDAPTTRMDFQVREFSFGLGDLDDFIRDWAPEVKLDLDGMAPGERFTVSGALTGTLDNMRFSGDIDSRIGQLETDIDLQHIIDLSQTMSIGGRIAAKEVHLGRILGEKSLGTVTLNTRLTASLPRHGDLRVQLDTLHVGHLQALGYNYSGIRAHGHYSAKDYELELDSEDPMLQMQARARYQENSVRDGALEASLQLDHANLQALNLDRRGKSLVALRADASIVRENGHALGDIITSQTVVENETGRRSIPDITLHIDDSEGSHRISLQSEMLEAGFTGERPVTEIAQDVQNLILGNDLSALLTRKAKPYSGAAYEGSILVHRKLQDLLAFVTPGLYIDNGTRLNFSISRDGLLKADVQSGRLALREQYIKDLRLKADNDFEALTGELTGSVVALSADTHLNNSRFTFFADNNQVGMGYAFDNEAEDNTHAELYVTGELDRNEKGMLGVTARVLPSNIYYKGEGWGLSSGDIRYSDSRVLVNQLLARHENQQLLLDGGYSAGRADTLSVTMDQFDIGLVNTIAGNSIPKLEGRATGRALLLSSASSLPGLLAGIVCDSTYIAGRRLGQLSLSSAWDADAQRFNAQLQNRMDGRSSIQAEAYLVPSSSEAQVALQLDRFELGYAEYFLSSIFHEFSGALSGQVKLDGKLNKLQLSSQDLWLDDGRIALDFTRVPYLANGPLSLDKDGLHFQDVYVTDGEGGSGSLKGGIRFRLDKLDDIRMDTHVSMHEMHAIALPRGVNPLAFGNVYASGKVDITGPLNKLTLSIDATSARSGEFHLPLGSVSTGSSRELLTFKEAPSAAAEDPYEQMIATARQTRRQQSDMHLTARIKATPELKVFIDIGDDNSLNAVGSGILELESSNSQGFSLGGDYTIQDGSFHFSALNLVSRNFTIQNGSSVRFNGDVWDTDLDVKGLYTTKASLSNLLPSYDDDESGSGSSSRRTVHCGINISGKIRNPEVDFDIEIPDLNPVIQGQVESALNSEDKVQKQFVYLLIAGNFLPTDESGVTTNGSDVLFSNVSSIMAGQLNNIFQKLDIPLDLGLNYQTTQAGRDLFDVAVSTQLFNNRVIVNGTVGNKQLAGGATTNEVAGDLDIEIKLNRSGSLRVSLFSHSADQYTYYLDNSQRNGGGITYQREFNSFGQFFRELFASRKKREAMALEAAANQANIVLQIDSDGKTQPIHE